MQKIIRVALAGSVALAFAPVWANDSHTDRYQEKRDIELAQQQRAADLLQAEYGHPSAQPAAGAASGEPDSASLPTTQRGARWQHSNLK